MSRCTQIMGLHSRAEQWLQENQKIRLHKCSCPYCAKPHREHPVARFHESAKDLGMFDDGPDLIKYQLKDDSWVYEYVQEAPWSSGPMIFLALRREDQTPIEETLWKEEEME